jgi:hypothetical protein
MPQVAEMWLIGQQPRIPRWHASKEGRWYGQIPQKGICRGPSTDPQFYPQEQNCRRALGVHAPYMPTAPRAWLRCIYSMASPMLALLDRTREQLTRERRVRAQGATDRPASARFAATADAGVAEA